MIQTVVKIVFYTLIWSNYWNIPIHMTLVVKNPPANSGDIRDTSSIPGLGRCPGVGNGNPPQYSCLKKSHGERSLQAAVQRVAKSRT